jgi:arginine decarboxylase
VLADVQYDTVSLAREMKQLIDSAIKSDVMKPSEGMRWLESYEKGLKSSTYLEFS